MTYSCSDFTDTILDALGIDPCRPSLPTPGPIPDEPENDPGYQADLCLAEIERLQRLANLATGAPPVMKARAALEHLIAARDLLKAVGAERTLDRVRHAISSAKGAVRHAEHRRA